MAMWKPLLTKNIKAHLNFATVHQDILSTRGRESQEGIFFHNIMYVQFVQFKQQFTAVVVHGGVSFNYLIWK